MYLSLLVHQQGTVPRHAHQHVAGALFLQGAGRSNDLFLCFQHLAHDLAQLVIVGFYEERVVLQHVHQQVAGGIHHRAHPPALQPGQQPLVGILRQTLGNAARQNEDIILVQAVQFLFQLLHGALRDVGARPVQLGLLPGFDLYIDAGHALLQMHKVGLHALCRKATLQPCTGLARHKAQCHAPAAQLCQHAGHVDALAAQHAVLTGCAVHLAYFQRCFQAHHIIDGRIECNCVDHTSVSFTSVNCLYFGLGQRLVRMAPPCRSAMTAG